MNKKFFGVISILIFLSTAATTVLAAPKDLKSSDKDPFQATYTGIIHGDRGSQAPLTLALSQVNDQISGTVYLGSRVYIDSLEPGGVVAAPVVTLRSEPGDDYDTDFENFVGSAVEVI
jgi:hypothetical protein